MFRRAALLVVAIVLVGGLVWVFIPSPVPPAEPNGPQPDVIQLSSRPDRRAPAVRPNLTLDDPVVDTEEQAPPPQVDRPSSREIAVASILLSEHLSIAEKAAELQLMLPTLSGDEQSVAAAHLSHLAEGEQVSDMVRLLDHPHINEDSKEEIFSNIYDQEPHEAIVLLLQVVEQGSEPFAEEAKTSLTILLAEDHGDDLVAWRKAVEEQQAVMAENSGNATD